ncbi:MAG TPA: hypothetical protein VNS29_15365 [Burkholderiaceae bacterium]|nr:hypothetical protein [Burkholderiaceae bacterium]
MTGMRLSTWAALRCREPEFQRFLGAQSETEAARTVRTRCAVRSRAELDSDPEAAQRFHQAIRIPYSQYLKEKEPAHV